MRYFAILALLLAACPASARTWYITPDGLGDAPTIQSGINAASAGDAVLVAAGEYYEHVTLKTGVDLVSESGPSATILDGQSTATVISADTVADVRVEGFTIRNGRGSGGNNNRHGGGIAAWNCGPSLTIIGNIVLNNHAWDGGGMHVGHGDGPTILDNLFEGNVAEAQSASAYGIGGAILFDGGRASLVQGNVFRANRSDRGGSAIDCFNLSEPTIDSNLFDSNVCSNVQPPFGAVLTFGLGVANVLNNTLVRNAGGYGVYCYNSASPSLTNTIIAEQAGQGSVACAATTTVTASCCNFFGNLGGDWVGCVAGQDGVNGNVSVDPLFCYPDGGSYYLQWGSPCLPANSPDGCGLIGAFGFGGCNSVSVTPDSWARVKARYR